MKLDFATVLRDAGAIFAHDRDVLLGVAGLFLFVPQFAMMLLLPAMPPLSVTPEMTEAEQLALAHRFVAWMSAYGGWYVLGALIVQAGSLILLTLYVDRTRPAVGAAIARARGLLPRYLLAMILVGIPFGLGVLTLILLPPGLYLLGRMIVLGPVLVAERPIGVVRAAARSWTATGGNGLVLTGLVSLPLLGGVLVAMPFTLIDHALRANAPNVVAIAMADAVAAGVAAAALLATALMQVAVYRRLASNGI